MTEETCNRRAFFRSLGRYATLGGLAAGACLLVGRRPGALPDQTCTGQGLCRGCAALNGCGLPAAASFKQAAPPGARQGV